MYAKPGHVTKTDLELLILLPPPPKYRDYKYAPLCLTLFINFLWDGVSLYNPSWSGTHFVDQASLELRDFLALLLKCWN